MGNPLKPFFIQIKNHPERKIANLGAFLSSYLSNDSRLAAHLLVLLDHDFALKHTEDQVLLKILSLLGERTIEIEKFLKKVIVSLRSDEIRQKAGEKLFDFSGEKHPIPYDHEQTLIRFAYDQEEMKTPLKYRVKKGDSLWKIAQTFHVSVKSLKELNKIKEGALKVGCELLIPEKENETSS